MEWLIEVGIERIVGYVNDAAWLRFLGNKRVVKLEEFASRPEQGNPWLHEWVSVLITYPLQPQEVRRWRLYGPTNVILREGNLEDV